MLLVLAVATPSHGAEGGTSITQSSSGNCSPNTSVAGSGHTITIIIHCKGTLEAARISMERPLLVDFRPIRDPGTATLDRLRTGPAVVSMQALHYTNQTQGGKNAQVLKQEATVTFDGSETPFRWFNFVDLARSKPGEATGWHGRIREAQPFTLDAGKTFSTTTMFRPEDAFTWSQALARIKNSNSLAVTVRTWISGVDADVNVSVPFEIICNANLARAKKDIKAFEERTGRQPLYVHIYCQKPMG